MYLFTRTGATWRQQAYIKGSNTEAFDEFGSSVALDRAGRIAGGDRARRGRRRDGRQRQPGASNAAEAAGAAYVFAVTR